MVIIIQSFKNYKNLSKLFKLSDSKHFQLKLNIVSITKQLQNISITTVLFHRKLELLVFSIILWQAGKDFIWRFTGLCFVSTQMHVYLQNINPFAGVPMFLICVLETFKCFYKQPFSFCLAKFAWFLYVSHMYGYLQKYEPIRRRSNVSNLYNKSIQVFL